MSKTPASSKPSYPIPWIATYFITALVLIAGSFVMVWYVNLPASKFDYSDPDMQFLERIVLSANPQQGDFSGLNGGDWQALCLVGWQSDLDAALKAADIDTAHGRAIATAYDAIAPDVLETEFVLVYVDGEGAAKPVHHPHGFAFAREGAAACTKQEKPLLNLPAGA